MKSSSKNTRFCFGFSEICKTSGKSQKIRVQHLQKIATFLLKYGFGTVQKCVDHKCRSWYIFIISFSISVLFSQKTHKCKSCRFRQELSVSPHVPFLNLLFEQIAIPTSIYLQKSATIQPRTSLSKFGGKFNSSFIRFLNAQPFTQLERWWIGNYDSGGAQQWEDISQYKRVLGESTRRLSF